MKKDVLLLLCELAINTSFLLYAVWMFGAIVCLGIDFFSKSRLRLFETYAKKTYTPGKTVGTVFVISFGICCVFKIPLMGIQLF
ncbi:MAG: hypothetical protein WC087_03095 [Candidatus Paceibacterota bacterium]